MGAHRGRRKAHVRTSKRRRRAGRSRLRIVLVAVGTAVLLVVMVGMRRRSRTAPARPARFEESVEIARPPEEVFAFVADPVNDARWTPQVEEVRKTSEGPLGVGSTFGVVASLLGRRFELSSEITEYDEANRKVGLRISSGPLGIEAVRTVEAIPEEGARFTISPAEIRTGGFFWLLDPLFGVLLRRQGKQTLDNLKAFLETRS